ncbi:MAG: Hsp70 family protein [Thermomicrobiales bacterium]
MPDLAIGFDFGTSNSAVAVADPATGQTRLLHLDSAKPDSALIPTLLYIEREGAVHLGYDAIDSFVRLEAGRTIVRQQVATEKEIDTVFGRELVRIDVDISQPGRFFQSLKSFLADTSYGGTKVFGQFHTLEDLVAIILREMRERAEAETGQAIRRATVGRPVHWAENDPDGDALAFARMQSALRLAGFEDVTFVPEPIAAGLHFASTLPAPRTVLVFDFGGGTLDVTVMRIGGGERTVLSTAGTPLGGNTLDEDIMDGRLLKYFGEDLRWGEQGLPMPRHILDAIRRWYTIPVLNDARIIEFLRRLQHETARSSQRQVRALIALVRSNYGWPLFREIERAKIGLSAREQERIGFFAEAIAINEPLTRRAFEALIGKRIRQAERCIDDALAAAGLADDAIDAVLRTGGSSTIPRFQRLLTDRFGADKLRFQDAFTSVATGLALSAAGQVAALPAA